MNILFISAILPYPLYSGGQVRIYNLLKRLSRDHHITLCAYIRNEEEQKYKTELSFCADVNLVLRGHAWQPSYIAKSLMGTYPFVMSTYDIKEMKELIIQKIRTISVDCIHIEPGYVWPAVPETNIPIVVGEHNIEHAVYQEYVNHARYPFIKAVMKRDVRKLIKWEEIIWKKASHITTVSEEDAVEVRKITSTKTTIVPNGIDEDVFKFNPKKIVTDQFTCLFVGNFRWIQNVDAAKLLLTQIWPKIYASFPKATLRIVGRDFPKNLRSHLSSSVNLITHVEDIRDEFYQADIVLAPIRVGGGTKYKILEAMAAGVPVITTPKGTQGLPLINLENCFIADTSEQWTNVVHNIVKNNQLRSSVVKNARMLVEKEFSWERIAKELSGVWKSTKE